MPPKNVAKKQAAKPKNKKEDDDDALLADLMKTSNAAAEKLAQEKKAADKKKAEQARQDEAAERKRLKAFAAMPPVFVNDVAAKLYEKKGGDNHTWRDDCWGSYSLNNFFAMVVEHKRRLFIKTDAHPDGEPVESFNVHDLDDEDGCPHCWNVINAASGTYCLDLALKQFLPKGRYGFQHDGLEAGPFTVVKAASRLVKEQGAEPLVGVCATDGGILPGALTVVADGVETGKTKKYINFLSAARAGRYSGMNENESKTARIMNKRKVETSELVDHHKYLEEVFYPAPAQKQ